MSQQKFTSNTIDEKHTEMMNYFNRIETEIIPQLESNKKIIIDSIPLLKEHQIDQYLDMRDKIISIKKEIRELKKKKKKLFLR